MEASVDTILEKLKWIDRALFSYSVYTRNTKVFIFLKVYEKKTKLLL
jgi:hypothetical protein